MKRGQGTFEYVLLLGGVLLIVVLAIVVLQNTAQSSFSGAETKQCSARLLSEISCLNANASWKECGLITTAAYTGCGSDAKPVGCLTTATATQKYCGIKPLSG